MEQSFTPSVTLELSDALEADFHLANRQHGIRLYRDEASRLNINESILLSDDNFAVILGVHHSLHCLVSTLNETAVLLPSLPLMCIYREGSARLSTRIITTQIGQKNNISAIVNTIVRPPPPPPHTVPLS